MAIGDRYIGKNWFGQFIYTGGTVNLHGDQTAFEWTGEADMVDASAGSTGYKEYLAGIKDGSATLTIHETGSAGSAVAKAIAYGNSGTLIWGPQGNATGKPKYLVPALVKSNKVSNPYDDVTSRDVEFQFNGQFQSYEVDGIAF